MAKGKVSIDAIENFISSVDSSKMDVINSEGQIKNEISSFIRECEGKLRTLESAIGEAEVAKQKLDDSIDKNEKELESINKQLENTPSTITDSYLDRDGNRHYETQTNPMYLHLMGQKSSLESKITMLEKHKNNIENAQKKASDAVEKITENMEKIQESHNSMTSIFPYIYDKYERCYMMSSKALEVIQEYNSIGLVLSNDVSLCNLSVSDVTDKYSQESSEPTNEACVPTDLKPEEDETIDLGVFDEEDKDNQVISEKEKKRSKLAKAIVSEIQILLIKNNINSKAELDELIFKYKDKATIAYKVLSLINSSDADTFARNAKSIADTLAKFGDVEKIELEKTKIEARKILFPTFDKSYGWREKLLYREVKKLIKNADVDIDGLMNSEYMKTIESEHTLVIDQSTETYNFDEEK